MGISDDDWIAGARSRVERGEDWGTPDSALFYPGPVATPTAIPVGLNCPYCAAHPPLQVYPRAGVLTAEPIWFCSTCYGFWAPAGAVPAKFGVKGDDVDPFPARPAGLPCRSCLGPVDGRAVCGRCGVAAAPAPCPSCGQLMARTIRKGATFDECTECRRSWFDTSEIAAVYNLTPPRSLAEQPTGIVLDPAMSPWMFAFDIVLSLLSSWAERPPARRRQSLLAGVLRRNVRY